MYISRGIKLNYEIKDIKWDNKQAFCCNLGQLLLHFKLVTVENRDASFEYHRAVVPFCRAVRTARSLSTT